MPARSTPLFRLLLPFFTLFLLWSSLWLLTRPAPLADHHFLLPQAIAVDLFLTAPLLYFLLIRKTAIPALTVIPVFLLSLVIGQQMLPPGERALFDLLHAHRMYVAELLFLILETGMVLRLRKRYRAIRRGPDHFLEDLRQACVSTFGSAIVGNIMASEISLFVYLVRPVRATAGPNAFSYHKRNGLKWITGVFCFLILVETAGFHFLVALWNETAAWVLSLSSVYALIFLAAHYKASAGLPVLLTPGALHLRNGLKGNAVLPFQMIGTAAQTPSSRLLKHKNVLHINALGTMGGHNVVLHLNQPLTVQGMWGRTAHYDAIALELDDPSGFMAALESFRDAGMPEPEVS